MTCETCPYKSTCKLAGYCLAQGKPWEPQDNKRTVQMEPDWWEKRSKQNGEIR